MYLYSNIIGTFVFNQNVEVREKVIFSKSQIIKFFPKLSEGEIIEPEKKFLKKFKKIRNLRQNPETKVMLKVNKFMDGYLDKYYENNLILTKQQIRDSVTTGLLIVQTINSI